MRRITRYRPRSKNARVSTTELSRRVKMPPSRIVERLRKLEENKIILRYETRLDGSALGANWLRSYS
jgi:Lrp/AsnC family leucine-responsive transcriptional regulator